MLNKFSLRSAVASCNKKHFKHFKHFNLSLFKDLLIFALIILV